ncbi:unknown [Salmonella phage FelixO1]|uniref:Uncharacterized protein n=1 Tax=Salmonella phage Felix O1 (isolate Felix O1-VT1) TaxID=1283336 RepID=Q6KGU6_BPFO1|nr:unknown [Salmonella phage FelixO1]
MLTMTKLSRFTPMDCPVSLSTTFTIGSDVWNSSSEHTTSLAVSSKSLHCSGVHTQESSPNS